MKRKYDLYLKDIIESTERIHEYVGSMGFNEFKKNAVVIDAVMRNLEIIGEAATQLPKQFKEKHNDIPWRDIQDFRIVAAHHYWKINIERIWDIIEHKLDILKKQIQKC